jgi:hypothetical protein
MNRKVDRAVQQLLSQGTDEDARSTDLRKRSGISIAFSGDAHQLDGDPRDR